MMKKIAKASVIALAASSFAAPLSAQPAPPPDYVQAGTLTCDVSAGIGLIVTSQKSVTCLFKPVNNAQQEVYTGFIRKFGIDLGSTSQGQMIWTVFSPTSRPYGALTGNYAGASAQASIGAGLGANVLLGGSDRTVALQPLSIDGQLGVNVAVGVAELELRPVAY